MAKRNVFGRIYDAILGNEPPALVNQSKSFANGYNRGYQSLLPTKFMQVLQSNFLQGEIAPDPIRTRDLYPIVLWAIPQLAATLDIHARVTGVPRIESKDAAFVRDCEAFFKEFTWKGESAFPYDTMRGIAPYIYLMTLNTMTTGQSFATAMDSNGQQVTKSGQKIAFVRLHDSSRFNYQAQNVDDYILTYEHGGILYMPVLESAARDAIRFRTDSRYPYWGVPTLYGTERDSTTAMMSGEALRAHNARVANPSSILMASFNPNMAGAADDVQMIHTAKDEWDSKMTSMAAAYAEKQGSQNRSGQAWQAFEFHAGGEVKFSEHVMGKDMKPAFTYDDEVKPLIAAAVVGAFGVPDMVGLSTTSGGGIGSDQYTQQAIRMEGYGQSNRLPLSSHVQWLMYSHFLRSSTRVPKYELVWDGLNLASEKGKAETAKIWSETEKAHAETAQMINEGAGIAAVNAWLKAQKSTYFYPESAV